MNTAAYYDMLVTIVDTFTYIYEWFLSDLGGMIGFPLLKGVTVFETMFGVGLVIFMGATVTKWLIGIIM